MTESSVLEGYSWYLHNPDVRLAWRIMSLRDGRPKVQIACGYSEKDKHMCGRPFGGAWPTTLGSVIAVNRLNKVAVRHKAVEDYRRVVAIREERERRLIEDGFFYGEMPVALGSDGKWRTVPTLEGGSPKVYCTEHGAWGLDTRGVVAMLAEARVTKAGLRFNSVPPG